ncbi:Tetratricopeptide repeat-containing protein [Nonlabens sp. Hel1_33_55]|uniref:tetratricopeptide repeat protein n=1 Tax=Nonlabens sp. Hel1_33_55 TaxID=1336802 RepID=UPI000875AA05|nr:tetratricopeptide repeat protein [Nonlabens sp. Hel1_33_55]SCY42303.1 Tetratricopeptide repeat-containing protein [Nonlabens sp. Hel1_33_55]
MKYFLLLCLLPFAYLGQAQNLQLADNYADQGEYDKAYAIYAKAYATNERNFNILFRMVGFQQQLENYERADSLLNAGERVAYNKLLFPVEKGYNASLQGKDSLASNYYKTAIQQIDSIPRYGYNIAQSFERRSLLKEAIESYERTMAVDSTMDYNFQTARLYGEQGELAFMFEKYLDLMEKNEQIVPRIQAVFSQYVTDDAANSGNQELRKTLLLRLRKEPKLLYNQILSWLFVQQKDFNAAFVQEKAIYNRTKENMFGLQDLAETAHDEQDDLAAENILNYIIETSQVARIRYLAQVLQLKIKTENAQLTDYPALKTEYESLLEQYGADEQSFVLQLDYANFLAFKSGDYQQAIDLLSKLEKQNLGKYQKAESKMLLADILVLQEQFNRALILYSQVQNDLPNSEIAQESQFKVARTSYFQGDFKWSLTQLKVLRGATSKLIANDAMELSLTISDHSLYDTTFVALKAFAKAELKQYQNKNQEALSLYQSLLLDHKGDDIEDEALLQQASLFELERNWQKAQENYNSIISNFSDGILADDAYYRLGLLLEEQLGLPEEAQKIYEKVIYNHADSIFFIDARRRYRRLRGDFEPTEI